MTISLNQRQLVFQPIKRSLFVCSLAYFLVCSQGVFAFQWNPTELQYALLPEHCKVQLSSRPWRNHARFERSVSSAQHDHWEKRIGRDFQHMHHYCAGLGWLMMAESPTMLRRAGINAASAYGRAVGEIGYTINQSSPSSPLWIEMNIAQARARAGLGKYDQAITQLSALLQQKNAQKRSDIYVELGKVFHGSGNIIEAIEVLEQGMKKVPKKGPLLFYLARYYNDIGDLERSAELTARAEAAGMKMDSLRGRQGAREAARASNGSANQPKLEAAAARSE